MAEVIVIASTLLAVAFAVAWAVRPDLRDWIERPKYTLDRNLRGLRGHAARQRGVEDARQREAP